MWPPVTLAEKQRSYQQAITWIRNHESELLMAPNAALWWMLRYAAQRTGDVYLTDLVRRVGETIYARLGS
jgi:hypothetical protein